MFKIILSILVTISVIGCDVNLKARASVVVDDTPKVNKIQCGKYAIHEDEARMEIEQLVDNAELYIDMIEVEAKKMRITAGHAIRDDAMGVTKNKQVFQRAAQDILNKSTKLNALYDSVMFEIDIKIGVKALIDSEYTRLCGDYVTSRDDLHKACKKYPDILADTINCRVLAHIKNTKEL